MIIPKKHIVYVTFSHNNVLYKITANENDRSVYHLYKSISNNEYEFMGTSNNPLKLEDKVREGR